MEALLLHGGRPILPATVDRIVDVTLGIGAGFSLQGEVCGAISGHIIAIGIDVAYRLRETAYIRKVISTETRKFCSLFRDRFEHLRCYDLIGRCFLESELPTIAKSETASPPLSPEEQGRKCENIVRFCIYAPLPSEEEEPPFWF